MTLAQAKLNLRVAAIPMPLDDEITNAIDGAAEQWEQDTDSPCIAATYLRTEFRFPIGGNSIQLSKKPVQSVEEISYTDEQGDEQVLDPAVYSLDKGRRQIYLAINQEWPVVMMHQEAVKISYVAGYQTQQSVPRLVQRAVMLQVSKWFFDPAMESSESQSHDMAYERLVLKHLATFHAS